ncbi:MAG: membrane integrity-associated transporter subunit PqiC [Vitreoscilla sp.]
MTRLSLLTALALVAGCSTPPDYYHTLRPAVAPAPTGARETQRVLAIGPVTIPDSLARDEWVIRTGDTGAMVYDHQLWTQGLAADVAQSLADYLNRGALPEGLWADAGPTGSGSGADLDHPAPLRVRVQVLRLDSILAPAPAVSDQLRWTIECLPSDPALGPVDAGRYRMVRTAVRDAAEPAPAGNAAVEVSQQRFDRIARAHSETVRLVADDIAAALRASAAERARGCVGRP